MSESAVLKTKFGNAKLNEWGYYKITSRKEGNHGKLLHRLIFEDFYKINLDEEFEDKVHIHHIDENKTNNEIWNLEPISVSEHMSFHNSKEKHHMWKKPFTEEMKKAMSEKRKGMKNSKEHNQRISETRTSTGFFRVSKRKNVKYKQGFLWCYNYYPEMGKRQKMITSTNLLKLKEKVLSKGLDWFIIDIKKARRSVENKYNLNEVA